MRLRVLDLFSGIGGFSLGLESTGGFETAAFCEIDPYCRAVLARHWPGIPIFGDICELSAQAVADAYRNGRGREQSERGADRRDADLAGNGAQGIVDVLCGGFPCQDLSVAGKGAGLAGDRSGLWRQYLRLIGELRPRYVIVENVAALLSRGLGTVLGDLASIGYDAEWHCIPASYVGAPHRRDRIWIVAYPGGDFVWDESGRGSGARGPGAPVARDDGEEGPMAHADLHAGHQRGPGDAAEGARGRDPGRSGERPRALAHTYEQPATRRVDPGAPEGSRAAAPEGTVESGDPGGGRVCARAADVADPGGARLAPSECQALFGEGRRHEGRATEQCGAPPDVADADGDERHGRPCDVQMGRGWREGEIENDGYTPGNEWSSEPTVGQLVNGVSGGLVRFNGRVATGVQDRVQKLRALGNAIVPQIAQMIGRAILELEQSSIK